jgi:hypothetical protein
MAKPVAEWTDARLDDLAAALLPLPTQVAMLTATVDHLDHVATEMEPMPRQLAVLTAAVDRLTAENRDLRAELAATQRQIIQIAWALVGALLGAAAALTTALF